MIPAVQLAIGLVALAFVVRSRFRPATGWLATAWLGQVAILQILRGGRGVGYDRIIVEALLSDNGFWLLVLALQAAAVAAGVWRSRKRLLFPVCALAVMFGTGGIRWTPPIEMTLSAMAVA